MKCYFNLWLLNHIGTDILVFWNLFLQTFFFRDMKYFFFF